MKVFLGADHRGFQLKEQLKPWLTDQGFDVIDLGADHLDPDDDYVDFALSVARKLAEDHHHNPVPDQSIGIGICGSGIGISIAANRLKTIRAALCVSPEHAAHARKNDHANMLSLASDHTSLEEAQEIIKVFAKTKPIRTEKYLRRVQKLDAFS